MTILTPFPYRITPIANIGAFTYADGATYLSVLEEMRSWLNGTLLPAVNTGYESYLAQAQAGVDNAEAAVTAAKADWDTRYDALMADLTGQIQTLNDTAVGNLVTNAASTTGTAIRALIDSSVNNTVTAAHVIDLLGTTYYTRGDADARYTTKTEDAANRAADKAAADAAYAPAGDYAQAADLIHGAEITVYGHSYTPVPGAYVQPGEEWSTKLAAKLDVTRTSYGESGARMQDMAFAAIGKEFVGPGGNRSYPAGKKGLVIVECEMNDALFGATSPAGRKGFTHGLRALLATVTAGQRLEASSAVLTGTWNTFTYGVASNGTALYTTTDGSTVEWSNVSAPAGYVYVLTYANDDTASPTGTLSVSVDDVTQVGSYVGQGEMVAYTTLMAGNLNFTYSPAVIRVPVPAKGTHTVRVGVFNTSGSKQTWVDALLVPPAVQVPVLVCKDPPVGGLASATNQDAWNANSPTLHSIIDSVAGEFPSARVIDLGPGWVPATMVAQADGAKFHPNAAGMEYIAETLKEPARQELSKYAVKKLWA